jgi:hypothetical protein
MVKTPERHARPVFAHGNFECHTVDLRIRTPIVVYHEIMSTERFHWCVPSAGCLFNIPAQSDANETTSICSIFEICVVGMMGRFSQVVVIEA